MRKVLLAAAALSIVALSCSQPLRVETAPKNEGPAPVPSSLFAGSKACAACHQSHFDGWQKTVHPLQERLATPETVVGDFETGRELNLDGLHVRPFHEGERYFVESTDGKGGKTVYPLTRVVGGTMYKQRYVTTLPNGADAALPLEWNMREKRFQPFHAPSGYRPGQAEFWGGPSRAWARRCAGCHVVGLTVEMAKDDPWPRAHWVELGVGCESCHGAGAAHARDPKQPIVNPAKLPPQRVFSICASCHARGTAFEEEGAPTDLDYPVAFKPGTDAHRTFRFSVPLEGLSSWAFWANKQSRQHHQQANDFERSPHFQRAGMSCIDCHESHGRARYGSLRKEPKNALCTDCHSDRATPERLEAHTHHKASSPGSACIECHMPKTVTHANPFELRAHTQWIPQPAIDAQLHVPEACTLCHKDRERTWAAETVDSWRFGRTAPITSTALPNLRRLSDGIFSSGKPEGDAGFRAAAALGIRTIVSVDGEKPNVEAARRAGLRHVHLPFGYANVPRERQVQIAKAIRELPGPVLFHCHRGAQRGPAAAAIAHLVLDGCSKEEAVETLRAAGNDPRYKGLGESVLQFVPPTPAELAAAKLPETAEPSSLASRMVEIDKRFDRLQAGKPAEGDWKHEALLLREDFVEAGRATEDRDAGFKERLEGALEAARALEAAPAQPPAEALARVKAACARCHDAYRDR